VCSTHSRHSPRPSTAPFPQTAPPVENCKPAVDGVVADGGRLVDRATVYNTTRPPGGHYIALAVRPPSKAGDANADFHFWRLDSNGAWSYKVRCGPCLPRRAQRASLVDPPRPPVREGMGAALNPRRRPDTAPPPPPAPQAGDTLVRNTLRDGTPITDIERDAVARGDYTEFCGSGGGAGQGGGGRGLGGNRVFCQCVPHVGRQPGLGERVSRP
jgi:hypothetical protein